MRTVRSASAMAGRVVHLNTRWYQRQRHSVINYDGAKSFLLGEENQGLAAMFTMMNYERLSVGLQGLGAALAYQHSASYAR